MAITNGYTDLPTVKSRLGVADSDSADDAALEGVITAVSRWIDQYCSRRFYAATETRYYTAARDDRLFVDDLLTVTSLKTDDDGDRTYDETWTTGDYDLEPFNAALDGQPYTSIATTPEGDYSFPVGMAKGVQLAGSFGYNATGSAPAPVQEACVLRTVQLWKRIETLYGVASSPEFGGVSVLPAPDPYVVWLLNPYRRPRLE